MRRGGAAISERHANVIVNLGEARAADVLELMAEARRRVRELGPEQRRHLPEHRRHRVMLRDECGDRPLGLGQLGILHERGEQNVLLARLTGTNKEYIEQQIPHLSKLLCNSVDEVLEASDVVVIGNTAPEFGEAITRCRPDQVVLDLVRVSFDPAKVSAQYQGICW